MRPAQMYTVCLIALVFVYPTEARGLSKLWSIIDVDLLNSSTNTNTNTDEPVTYLWPMPKKSSNGNMTIAIDPDLVLVMQGNGGHSRLLRDAFARYKQIILAHHVKFSDQSGARQAQYGIGRLIITVPSADETLQLGTNESYSLYVPAHTKGSVIQDAMLENGVDLNVIFTCVLLSNGNWSLKVKGCDQNCDENLGWWIGSIINF